MTYQIRSSPVRRQPSPSKGLLTVDSVVSAVRALWSAIEAASGADQARLKAEIAQTINRLKNRLESRLGAPAFSTSQPLLFDRSGNTRPNEPETPIAVPPSRFPEPVLRVYAKDLADHALHHLPQTAKLHSIDEVRKHLIGNLRFNSEATRRRNANYLINRYFPGERFNSDLPAFAAATANTSALGDALFYLTCRTEKIVASAAQEIVFPSLAQGGVSRSRIRDFVQSQFPHSKSAKQVGVSIIGTYQSFGIGTATRARLNVALREGSLASFAYVLHLEFPEPGMHSFEQLLDGPMHKWLLWDQQWMIGQLYRLREAGLLSKVSEIDRMRQFTTKHHLADAVRPIVDLATELRR